MTLSHTCIPLFRLPLTPYFSQVQTGRNRFFFRELEVRAKGLLLVLHNSQNVVDLPPSVHIAHSCTSPGLGRASAVEGAQFARLGS